MQTPDFQRRTYWRGPRAPWAARSGLVVLWLLVAQPAAHAEENAAAAAAARTHFEYGTQLYQLGEYRKAVEQFKAAYLSKRDPAFLYNIGQAYRQLSEPAEEIQAYRSWLREAPATAPHRKDVEQFIQDAERELARRDAEKQKPPTAVLSPAATTPQPAVAASPDKPRRWWIPVVVAGGALVIAGAAVGIAFALPGNASSHDGSEPTTAVHF